MNRIYKQFPLSLENRVVQQWARVAVGATGAPTLNAGLSKGIASVTRNSAGRYTIVFQDQFVGLLNFQAARIFASGAPLAAGGVVIRTDSVATSSRSLVIEWVNGSGVAEELPSGTTMLLEFVFKASTV